MSEVVISIIVHDTPEEIRPQDIKRIEEEIVLCVANLFAIELRRDRDSGGRLAGTRLAAPSVHVGVRAHFGERAQARSPFHSENP